MRICFWGAANSIHTIRYLQYFIKSGYDVHLITFHPGNIEGVKIHRISRLSRYMDVATIINYPEIRQIIDSIHPDIFHAICLINYGFYVSALGLHPIVITALGSDVLVYPNLTRRYKLQLRYTVKIADLIIVDADYVADKLKSICRCPNSKIVKAVPGVGSSWLCKKSMRKQKRYSSILSCRNLEANYNIDIILEIFEQVYKRFPEAQLAVAGGGSKELYIKKKASKLLSKNNIKFTGLLSHSELRRYMENSEVFISIPTSDATSVSLLEAMATGMFPIVSNIPANKEWIRDGYNGYIVPWNDPNLAAERVTDILNNNELRKIAAKRNLAIIKEKGIFEKNIKIVEDWYHRL